MPAELTGNRATWEWAAELARQVGTARGWPDGGAALSDAILGYVDMDRDPTDPTWWETLADTVEGLPYDGAAKLASVYREAGGMTGRAAYLDYERSALGIAAGTAQGTVEDVAAGVTAAEEVAASGAKGLSKLVKSPLGILLGIAALGLGVAASRRL